MNTLAEVVLDNPSAMERVSRALEHWRGYMQAGVQARERGDARAARLCFGAAMSECTELPGQGLLGDHYQVALEGYGIALLREGHVAGGRATLRLAWQ